MLYSPVYEIFHLGHMNPILNSVIVLKNIYGITFRCNNYEKGHTNIYYQNHHYYAYYINRTNYHTEQNHKKYYHNYHSHHKKYHRNYHSH